MGDIEMESECTRQEINFFGFSDIDINKQSRHVDEMNVIACNDDDDTIDMIHVKTEDSLSLPVLKTSRCTNLLKGSTLHLILSPIDETNGRSCYHQCRVCPKIFLHIADLFKHEQTHGDIFSCVGKFSVRKQVVVPKSCSDGEESKHGIIDESSSDDEGSNQGVATESCSDGEVSDLGLILSCAYCCKKFNNSATLARHVGQAHKRANKYSKKSQVNKHDISDSRGQLAASELTSDVNQSIHLNGYNPGLGDKCCICEEMFQSDAILHSHYKYKHTDQSSGIVSCVRCAYKTKEVRNFVIHGRTHTGDTPYVCGQCDVRYISQNGLSKHIRSVHEGVKPFDRKCPQCGKRFRQFKAFMLHRQTHTDEYPHVCEECNKRFVCRYSLKRHCRYVHDQTFEHVCTECGQDYSSSASLNLHIIRQHRTDVLSLSQEDNKLVVEYANEQCDESLSLTEVSKHEVITESISDGEGSNHGVATESCSDGEVSDLGLILSCAYCCKKFNNSATLARHVGQAHKRANRYSKISQVNKHNVSDTREQLVTSELTSGVNQSLHLNGYNPGLGDKCCICEELFQSDAILHSHYKYKHTNQSSGIVSCVWCAYKTKEMRNFVIHGRTHTGDTPYVCGQCDVRYISQNALGKHIKSVHEGVKPFDKNCPQCGKRFSQFKAFMLHRQTHTDEYPHVCEECDKRFMCHKSLKRHCRYVHDQTFEHVCTECGQDYSSSASLNLHIIRHHGTDLVSLCQEDNQLVVEYANTQCDESLSLAANRLLNPKSEPTDECKFQCMQCGAAYESINELNVHETSHVSQGLSSAEHTSTLTPQTTPVTQSIELKTTPVTQSIEQQTTPITQSIEQQTTPVTQPLTAQTSVFLIEHKNGFNSALCRKCYICQEMLQSETILYSHYKYKHRDKSTQILTCVSCEYKTKDVRSFAIHGRKHTGETPYGCDLCGEHYISQNSLGRHIKAAHQAASNMIKNCSQRRKRSKSIEAFTSHLQTHTGERTYVCDQCDKRFSYSKSLTVHIQKVHDKSVAYVCEQCGKNCRDQDKLELHIASYHGRGVCSFPCTVCGEKYPSIVLLKEHQVINQHTPDVQLANEPQTQTSMIKQRSEYSLYTSEKCCICSEIFESYEVLCSHYTAKHYDKLKEKYSCIFCHFKAQKASKFAEHGRIHTGEKPYICIVCDKRYTRLREIENHVKWIHHDGEKYNRQCSQCGERFKQRETFQLHRRTHKGEYPYVCEQCEQRFICRRNLTLHIQYVHDKVHAHVCAQCGCGCKNSSKLKMHMIIYHEGEYSYLCTVCGKKYATKPDLKKHEITHIVNTGEKTFKCSQCDKKFFNKYSRTRHMSAHNSERPYVCVECDKTFKRNWDLKTHLATHSYERPFHCQVCGKMYGSEQLLRTHLFGHIRWRKKKNACEIVERRYACLHCDKKFHTNTGRTVHTRAVHFGERPFVCVKCGKMFKQGAHLKTHMKSHATK